MENSKVIEIFDIVRSRFILIQNRNEMSGICKEIIYLERNKHLITYNERVEIINILYANKPNEHQFTEFTQVDCWTGGSFWWDPVDRNINAASVRVRYLTELINKLKHEEDSNNTTDDHSL
jgi:hypothetical protein